MTLTAGSKLGPYEILGPLGAGAWAKCIARGIHAWGVKSR